MNAQNNNNRQQNNSQHTVVQQQANFPQQDYTCSNQQGTSWIRPQIKLQTIPVALFNRDLSFEAYALLDSGSDNTQITQKVADALQVQQPKDITLPLASLHGEHSVKTADVMIVIEALCSSCLVIRIPVYHLPLNIFKGPDGHNNNGYNNNLYNGFPSCPPDWMQQQALMIQNTLTLPKISIDNFTGDPLK